MASKQAPATTFFNKLRASEKIKPRPTRINPHISFATQRILSAWRVDDMPLNGDNEARKS
jgi:hypothetical protein